MAQLDPSIILGYKPIEMPDQTNLLLKGLQAQAAIGQNQLQQQTIQTHQNALRRAAGLEDAYKSFTPGMKLEDQAAALTQRGYGQEGLAMLDKASGINKDNAQASNYTAEAQQKTLAMKGGIATALSQKPDLSYNDVGILRQRLQQQGVDVSDFATIPPNATPEQLRGFFAQYGQGAMTSAQQMSQKLDQQRLAETSQHDRATEATARGQLGVAQGHLSLARNQAAQGNQAVTYQTVKDAAGNETLVAVPTKIAPGGTATGMAVTNADGSPLVKSMASSKPLTEAQANAALYASRAGQSDAILQKLDGQYSPSGILLENKTSAIPGIAGMVNSAMSDSTQKAAQAQRDFVTAILRKESGASISPTEFATARAQYFPQPGDGAAVIQQKAANRANAIAGIKMGAGAGASPAPVSRGGPQPGTVEDGHRFRGGNPADPSNWEKI